MGDAWERILRLVKECLEVVLKAHTPDEEMVNIVLTEIENPLN